MKLLKKVTAVLLSAVMIFSLGACNSKDKNNASQTEQTTDTGKTSTNAADTTDYSFPLKEPVKLSVFIPQGSDAVNIPDTVVFQELQKATNIEFDLTMVPSVDAGEKLNMLLASGEYPDVIMGSYLSIQDLEKYGANEKILVPLNDLIDQYCPNIKERWEEHPNWKEEMKSSDGNIYGIPSVDSGGVGHVNAPFKMWINQEWLDNLGLQMPNTTEEFKNVLMAFKNDDPNGNGIADEIPLSGCINSWFSEPYMNLLNAFGYFTSDYYYLKDGKINSILDQDYIREGLRYMNDLYEEGLIDPAAFTQDYSQLNAIGNTEGTEILGSAGGGHVGLFVDINNKERYNKYAMMLPLEGPDGYRGIPYAKSVSVNGAYFMITDECKYPEVAIQIADLFSSEEWAIRSQQGVQGIEWDYADEGAVGMDGVTPAKYKNLPYEKPSQVSDAWWWTYRGMEPNWKVLFQTDGDIMDPSNFEARLYTDTLKLQPFAPDVDTMPPLIYPGDDSTTFTQLSTAIGDYAKIAIVEFIIGKRNIDTDWDSYLADLEQLGYQDMIQLIQKTYDAKY
jgi:putative aldouronate transport system substrate-binding protein